ncbi:MAG: VWA domain-containing protein [Porphyromonadaceae bacterium]|nr:VWA domain-containing protein [Porphyromonadaceae bacterium]
MFRFAHPEYLFLFIPVVLLVGVFFRAQYLRKKNTKLWGQPKTLESLMPNVSYARPRFKFYLQLLAAALLVIVLAQPQFGTKEENIKKKGIEVMIALDVSNSMLTQDIQPSRLMKAKQILSQLIDRMSDDKVGMVVFAGDAYVQLPITTDYNAAKMFLSSINTDMVPYQGTAIGSAIDLSIKSFGVNQTGAGRAIVLITDGENHEDNAIEAAKLAANNGIKVFVIGMGSPEGGPIPIGGTVSFKKDRSGNVVVSKLNEEMASEIARQGNGIYVRADNTDAALKNITKQLDTLAKADLEQKVYAQYNEQFQSFAYVALILMILEFFVFIRKNKWFSRIRIFDVNK